MQLSVSTPPFFLSCILLMKPQNVQKDIWKNPD